MKHSSAVAAMPGATIGSITSLIWPQQAGAVHLGGLDELSRDLRKNESQHPHRERQVHRRVQDDEHQVGVEQIPARWAMIHSGRMAATTGRNFVEMKKNSTSRQLLIG